MKIQNATGDRDVKRSNKEALGEQFWSGARNGYALLSYLSDINDWNNILTDMSSSISSISGDCGHVNILDVGAGLGVNTRNIMQRLLSSYKITSTATLVEPSDDARSFGRMLFSSSSGCFGTGKYFESVSRIPAAQKHDVCVYMHSAYYVESLIDEVSYIKTCLLKPQGVMIFLTMRSDSPFFLGDERFSHKNCSQEVQNTLDGLGFRVTSKRVSSRVHIDASMWDNDQIVDNWMLFSAFGGCDRDVIRRKLRLHLSGNIDLGDELVIARSGQ